MAQRFQPAAPQGQSHWIYALRPDALHKISWFMAPAVETLLQIPMLFQALCAAKQISLITLSVREKSLREIKEILESSFLGQSNWYGIWDLEQHQKNSNAALLDYLLHYTGPHHLIICYSAEFSQTTELKKKSMVLSPDISAQQLAELGTVLPARVFNVQAVQLLGTQKSGCSLTHLLSSFSYLPLLGRTLVTPFKEQYLPRLVKSDAGSLFSFTDLFWQKKGSAFYAQWAHIKQLYTPHFWISFWADQFFRATGYRMCMRTKQMAPAQQLAARKLSFWFTKTGWQSVDGTLLIALHDILYTIDYRSKNGGDTDMIEYVYQRWFSRSS